MLDKEKEKQKKKKRSAMSKERRKHHEWSSMGDEIYFKMEDKEGRIKKGDQ